jgi:hypothetical protein
MVRGSRAVVGGPERGSGPEPVAALAAERLSPPPLLICTSTGVPPRPSREQLDRDVDRWGTTSQMRRDR